MKTSEVLGDTKPKNKDCFNKGDPEMQELLAKKRAADQAHLAQLSSPEKKASFC